VAVLSTLPGVAGPLIVSVNTSEPIGIDSLDNSAIPASTITPTGPGTLDGFMGTATGVGATFDNINLVASSPADLAVAKSGPATVNAGAAISYTITVTNNGPNAALNVQLSDPLPAGTTFVSLLAPAGWICSTPAVNAPGTVTCTRVSVPAGPNAFTLNVNAPSTAGGITNTATVTSANEGAAGNESGSATTDVQGIADLSITKSGPASALNNGNITYNITVSNGGPNAATSVAVSDVLPAGVTFVSATPSQGSCSGTTTVTCNLGTLNNGASATIAPVVNVTATTGSIANTATVTASSIDPTPESNGSTSNAIIAGSIPVAGGWTLIALAALLAMLGVLKMKM